MFLETLIKQLKDYRLFIHREITEIFEERGIEKLTEPMDFGEYKLWWDSLGRKIQIRETSNNKKFSFLRNIMNQFREVIEKIKN